MPVRSQEPDRLGSTFQGLAQLPLGYLAIHLLCVSNKRDSTNFRAINTPLLLFYGPSLSLPSLPPSFSLSREQRHNRKTKNRMSYVGVTVVVNT